MDSFTFSIKNPLFPTAYASFYAMHTEFEIIATPVKESLAKDMVFEISETIKLLDAKLNRHDSSSLISKINDEAGSHAVKIDDELYMLLELCRTFYQSTYGYFDITACSPFIVGRKEYGIRYLLNPSKHSIIFSDSSIFLDLGGIAKGYALDVINHVIKKYDVKNVLVNFGNSSVLAIGKHPYGEYWPVSVEHTIVRGTNAHTFTLSNSALSVSGIGAKKGHIFNPLTGQRVKDETMIVVEGQSALIVEILSTALYAAPKEKRKDIISNYQDYKAYEITCLFDGTISLKQIK